MTIHALQTALGVNIPSASEFCFIGDVHSRLRNFLRRDNLPGGCRLPLREIASGIGERVGCFVNDAVTLGALFVAWVLNGDEGSLQFAFAVKRAGVELILRSRFFDDARADQDGGVRPAKFPL